MKSVLISGALIVILALSATAQGNVFVPTPDPSKGSPSTWPFDDGPSWRYLFILNGSSLGHTRFKITDLAFAAAELIGVSLFHAGVTYNGTVGISGATNTCGTTITP